MQHQSNSRGSQRTPVDSVPQPLAGCFFRQISLAGFFLVSPPPPHHHLWLSLVVHRLGACCSAAECLVKCMFIFWKIVFKWDLSHIAAAISNCKTIHACTCHLLTNKVGSFSNCFPLMYFFCLNFSQVAESWNTSRQYL